VLGLAPVAITSQNSRIDMFGKLFGGATGLNRTVAPGRGGGALNEKKPWNQGFFYAPEWTRTTTLFTQDKALNLISGRKIRPPAAESSVLWGSGTHGTHRTN